MRAVLAFLILAGCGFEGTNNNASAPDGGVTLPACSITAIAAGGDHTCATRADGKVLCWGRDEQHEVGVAATAACSNAGQPAPCVPSPTAIDLPIAVTQLGLGLMHTCAGDASSVYCWGANDLAQFGIGGNGDAMSPPMLVGARAGATSVIGGEAYTCSLHGTSVRCSGVNQYGEVGDGTTQERDTPVAASVANVTGIGAGTRHACAISGGLVYCWGENSDHQVLSGPMQLVAQPQLTSITDATAVVAGRWHSCAVLPDRTVKCWGKNDQGQLGDATTMPRPGAVIAHINSVAAIEAGYAHVCAALTNGTVWCWGDDYSVGPVQIPTISSAVAIAGGTGHACALLGDGTMRCWGWNQYGQLGVGTSDDHWNMTPVAPQLCP